MSDRSFVEVCFGFMGGLVLIVCFIIAVGASFGLFLRAFLWASGIDL